MLWNVLYHIMECVHAVSATEVGKMETVSLLVKLLVCMALLVSNTAAQSDDNESE